MALQRPAEGNRGGHPPNGAGPRPGGAELTRPFRLQGAGFTTPGEAVAGFSREPIHPGMATLYRQQVDRLSGLLESEATREEAMAAIRGLVERVVLVPEDGVLRIDLEGDLAAILRLCSAHKQKPAAGGAGDGLEQAKLVAGARSHREASSLAVAV